MEATLAPRLQARGLSAAPRIAFLDPWPDFLQVDGWAAPADRIGLRPEPHTQPDTAWTTPRFPGREDRPLVLLTQGTNLDDRALYTELLESVLRLDVNVLITLAVGGDPDTFDADRSRVRPVGFVPFGQLLRDVDVVISPGGNGTVLGTLSAGVPLVLFPMFPSHRWSAEAASATGSAAVAANPREVGPALETVLNDPAFRSAARALADRMAGATSVDAAVVELTAIIPQRS
jgi:UDP:flavonoid glycosyltransferase YjiC (YdhE family)